MTAEPHIPHPQLTTDDPDRLYSDRHHATVLAGIDAIGPAEMARYDTEGYLAVGSAVPGGLIADAHDGIMALLLDPRGAGIEFEAWARDRLEHLDGDARLDAVRKFMEFVDHEERLRALASYPPLLTVVRRLLGSDDIALFQDMALLKPPGGGREKPWHQDNAYFPIRPGSPIIGVWIALDNATPENGCMHVVPGSHRDGPVTHFQRRDWQICDTDVRASEDVVVPLPAGGVLFFHGLLHHGTPSNRTAVRRRAVQFHYVPAAVARISNDERMLIFGSEGKDVSC